MADTSPRTVIKSAIETQTPDLISATRALVQAGSPNPPGDTSIVATAAIDLLRKVIPDAEIARYEPAPGIVNVVARISSGKPGRRLVFNGHLDTYPLHEHLAWSSHPLSGALTQQQNESSEGDSQECRRIYGRGVSDMKAGIAASIAATRILSERKDLWTGEIVLTLAGDEETMGVLGSKWLIENDERATGDAMICGDAGSPRIVRFGEKGLLWIEMEATGLPAHGAHVHKGISAINRLRKALDALETLGNRAFDMDALTPAEVKDAIATAKDVSEGLSGIGESHTLENVTVNIGTFNGGTSPNLMPSYAKAEGDIRLPVGVSVDLVLRRIGDLLDPLEGVTWRTFRSYDPNYTSPSHEIVQLGLAVSTEVMGVKAVPNMRVGASDSRIYRQAGIPTVVIGCTPNNMGGADEYVEVEELVRVAQVHTLMAYDYLSLA